VEAYFACFLVVWRGRMAPFFYSINNKLHLNNNNKQQNKLKSNINNPKVNNSVQCVVQCSALWLDVAERKVFGVHAHFYLQHAILYVLTLTSYVVLD
jgi:hypothetical protein